MAHHHEAIATIAKKHPQFWKGEDVTLSRNDFPIFLKTWNELRSDQQQFLTPYLVWKLYGSSEAVLRWYAPITSSGARVPVGLTNSGEETTTFQFDESMFLRPYLRRMNREILRQRLQTMLGGLASRASVLSRARRHRLFDSNVLIRVLPMYLQPGPVSLS
jgi:hypothetical protein